MQQEMGWVGCISKPRHHDPYGQYCFSKDFYVSKNFKNEEKVGHL